MPDIATLPAPDHGATFCLQTLERNERDRRRRAIQTAINNAQATYPNAARHLQHWLGNTGHRLDVRINFLDNASGLPGFLLRKHRPVIARGHRTGFPEVDADAIGIEGRLTLPSTNARSLQPSGREQVLDWQDSIRASMWRTRREAPPIAAPPLERDLSIALGGYIVHSRVRVKAHPPVRSGGQVRQIIEVMSWKVQVCDRYDWIVALHLGGCISGIAPIAIPPDVELPPIPRGAGTLTTEQDETIVYFNDKWMAEVELSGGAQAYEIFSNVFDAPANVRANFEAVNGTIRL